MTRRRTVLTCCGGVLFHDSDCRALSFFFHAVLFILVLVSFQSTFLAIAHLLKTTPPFLPLSVFNTSPSWSPAGAGADTCPPPSSLAAGWSGRGRWRSDAGRSFSGAASRTAAESLGGWSSAAAPKNEEPSPGDARWASRSASRDGLGDTSDTSFEDGATRQLKNVTLHWELLKTTNDHGFSVSVTGMLFTKALYLQLELQAPSFQLIIHLICIRIRSRLNFYQAPISKWGLLDATQRF